MDGFLKEDVVGSIRKGMSMDQIDSMISRQLKAMEDDYLKCRKYDDPNYGGEQIILQGKFEKPKLEDGTQFKDDKQQQQQDVQAQQQETLKESAEPLRKEQDSDNKGIINNSQVNPNEKQEQQTQNESAIQDSKKTQESKKEENDAEKQTEANAKENESGDEDEEDDNKCMEDYYQPLGNGDDNQEEDDQEWGDFQQEEFKDLPPERDPRKKEIDFEKIKAIMSSFTLQAPPWAQEQIHEQTSQQY